jgi:hypothetical protein
VEVRAIKKVCLGFLETTVEKKVPERKFSQGTLFLTVISRGIMRNHIVLKISLMDKWRPDKIGALI